MAIMGSVDIQFTDSAVYKVEIVSSNGSTFKNSVISTTLTAVVYRNKENITDTLPASAFKWKKINADGTEDAAWNDAHENIGNTVVVSTGDVQNRATFQCEIDI